MDFDRQALPFTKHEVEAVLFRMGNWKVPGPDAYPAGFYQHFWSIVGNSVSRSVLQCPNEGVSVQPWNLTQIILVPKGNCPTKLSQFRPISQCNVVYKIVAKVLANRLRKVIPNLISSYQNTFVLD